MTLLKQAQDRHNAGRTILFETVYGSKLYGCDLPDSDHDIRGVYAPGLYDFLRAEREEPCVLIPESNLGESDDILYYPDSTFVDQVLGMKTNCVEIFFAALQARNAGATLHPMMLHILNHKDVLITANPSGFIGHARQRCSRYITGEDPRDATLQANKFALAELQLLMNSNPAAGALPIGEADGLLERLCTHERIRVGPNSHSVNMLFIHTRQADLSTRVAELAKTISTRLARFMKPAQGISDKQKFKDLSTSLRMLETAAELMETGTLTFPIPTAERHRAIRQGLYEVPQLLEWINAAQTRAESVQTTSPLRQPYTQGEQVDIRLNLVADLRMMALKTLRL